MVNVEKLKHRIIFNVLYGQYNSLIGYFSAEFLDHCN